MSTPEQVEAAELRLGNAAERLRAYAERPYSEALDLKRHSTHFVVRHKHG